MTELLKTCELPHPIKLVYNTWISNNTVIPPAVSMQIDARVGGVYRLEAAPFEAGSDLLSVMEGEFTEVVPQKYLSYTWEWNHDGDKSIVQVSFSEVTVEAQTGTRIDLLHKGLYSPEARQAHDAGWDSYFLGLAEFLKRL